ncbi:MAG: (d)CMP kinase [Saprospiraceae bacterium]|nr:(d)CMP kinase [Saprospiraceae bacterium]
MEKKINIAIDGFSSCGKSTLAKDLAKALAYIYIDSGAMYRAVTLFFLQNSIDFNNSDQVEDALEKILLEIKHTESGFRMILNGMDVTEQIVRIEVSQSVSEVAAISAVRKKLVEIQQKLGEQKGVVMDGRDIGTVVFPHAEVKIFVTANVEIRAQRRYDELERRGMPARIETVKENLKHRDHIDSTRADSPLTQASDALLLDNSYMSREEQLFVAKKIVEEKLR